MQIALTGQRLLITGATQGLGEAIARAALACDVAAIVISGRDAAKGQALALALGPRVSFHAADLAVPAAAGGLFAAALATLGQIDGLVNAAGLTDRAGLLDGAADDWDRLFAVNARAPFFLMQAMARHLTGRRAPGGIVNILSINAHCGTPELAIYSATKAALATLTRNAAHAHMADRIRVNGINMGWAVTPAEQKMQAETLGHGPDWAAAVAAAMPLGRMLTMAEVANLAVYLLSDLSGLQTGTLTDLEQRVLGAPG